MKFIKGKKYSPAEHDAINAREYPGTRQLCSICGEPTGRCEDDTIQGKSGPLCEDCGEADYDAGVKAERARCADIIRQQLRLELHCADKKVVMVLRSILNPKGRTEQEIFDPSDTIYPERCPRVPDSIIGNILDHWELIPNDAKQELEDTETAFYIAMEQLVDWIQQNR